MKKTLLSLGNLSRTVGYIHVKIVPSTNHMAYTLTVEHTDADITDAQPKDRCVKLLWCWDVHSLCLSEMMRFATAKGKGGAGGVVSLSGISSSPSLGQVSAVLQGWMGSVEAWLDSHGRPTMYALQSLLVPFFSQLKLRMTQNPKHPTQPQYLWPHDEPACSSRSALHTSTQKWL